MDKSAGVTVNVSTGVATPTEADLGITQPTLEEAKASRVAQVKADVCRLLASTDWCVVRLAETGSPIPSEVQAWRTAVRETSNTLEAEILTINDLAAVAAYTWDDRWPEA